MRFDKQHVKRLLDLVANTRDEEIDCDTCLRGMAEFAESELVGADLPSALESIAEHIANCPECAEEYSVLQDVVRNSSANRLD